MARRGPTVVDALVAGINTNRRLLALPGVIESADLRQDLRAVEDAMFLGLVALIGETRAIEAVDAAWAQEPARQRAVQPPRPSKAARTRREGLDPGPS